MKTPSKKTVAYIIALLVPPLGTYLAVDMRHKWRHLGVITISALLTMVFYPLGLAFAILIIHTQMPNEYPSEEGGTGDGPLTSTPSDKDNAVVQPIPGLSDTGGDQTGPTPQPIPGLSDTGGDQTEPTPQPIPKLLLGDGTAHTKGGTDQPGEEDTDPSAEDSTPANASAEEAQQDE